MSDTEVEVDRAAIDAWRNDTNEMMRSVRAIPREENGAITGLRPPRTR